MNFPESEIVMLIIAIGALIFMIRSRAHLRRLHRWRLLMLTYGVLMTGWCATLLEHAFSSNTWNAIEHVAYVLGAVLFAMWCWGGVRESEEPG
jgi:urea transporter